MSAPDLIVARAQLTTQRALPTRLWQILRGKLLSRGIILLPSDTCYSLAALAVDTGAHDRICTILNRKKEPLSLAFHNMNSVEQWTKISIGLTALLERFTPGPITIVCDAGEKVPVAFTTIGVGSSDRTIGVRIPDSYVERDLACATPYLITTVAVRDPIDNSPIVDFGKALEIVGAGISRLKQPLGWAAIEGDTFSPKHSTVVRVTRAPPKVELIREGAVDFEQIRHAFAFLPARSFEDWG
jgi:L-threonylcarbamoyladenylate synthase